MAKIYPTKSWLVQYQAIAGGNEEKDYEAAWLEAWGAVEANLMAIDPPDPSVFPFTIWGHTPLIRRGIFAFDTTGLALDMLLRIWNGITVSPGYFGIDEDQFCFLSGNGILDIDMEEEIYGKVLSCPFITQIAYDSIPYQSFGSILIPAAYINSSGYTFIAVCTSPDWDAHKQTRSSCGTYYDSSVSYIKLHPKGYIWAEGTKFAYTDANGGKRTKEGTDTGDNGTPGYKWVDGDYQYYTDYLGNVRRILGTLTGLTGKLASQISINTKSPMLGTHYCYIDSSGNERCFEGTAA